MGRNPGAYQTKGIIRRPGARVTLPGGGYTEGDPVTVFANVWARVEGLKTFEKLQAMQTQAKPTVRIELPYRPGIEATMEFVAGGKVWKFTGPPTDESGDRTELVILAREA